MKGRCADMRERNRRVYFDKGITVCERWQNSFENFLADMGPRPTARHTIDRIDGSLGYSPENCRWATWLEQGNNTSRNKFLKIEGKTMTYAQAAREYRVPDHQIHNRVKREWTPEQCVGLNKHKGALK